LQWQAEHYFNVEIIAYITDLRTSHVHFLQLEDMINTNISKNPPGG